MKRFILILTCLAILYAGAVWALEGCSDFGVGSNARQHNENPAANHHHEADSGPHHSHSGQVNVHCPNLLSEFLITSRVFVKSSDGYVYHMAQPGELLHRFFLAPSSPGSGGSPPGSVHSKDLPRHLLLSVIRI